MSTRSTRTRPTRIRRTRPARTLGTGIVALGAIGAGLLVPQFAAGEPEPRPGSGPSGPGNSPAGHTAGSQIAKHEGTAAPSRYAATHAAQPSIHGLDVSGHQGAVNWADVAADGAEFAYVKATEGTGYRNPDFAGQYNGAYDAGLIRGAYHFALPNVSSGTAQADYLVDNGGAWSADGKTLPPALDLEYNPYGETCYGMSAGEMTGWVEEFSDRVHQRTGRHPTIYTSTSWWDECTGGSTEAAERNPLWIPRYGSSVGSLPAGWDTHTIWQYDDSGRFPGDQNHFNGSKEQLRTLATGSKQDSEQGTQQPESSSDTAAGKSRPTG